VGTVSPIQTAVITFSGSFTLGSISVVTQGATGLDFNVASGGTCIAGNAYTSSSTCTVNYAFAPKAPGQRLGAILIYDTTTPTAVLEATVYLSGTGTGALAAFTPGIITTVAGNGTFGYVAAQDGGAATSAELYYPQGIAVDGAGNLYIADSFNYRIRKVTAATGIITTVAGGGSSPGSCTGHTDSIGDGCAATSAEFSFPENVTVDGSGNLYIADYSSQRIRKVTAATGIITTVAGNGTVGYEAAQDSGAATNAELNYPTGVGVDGSGNLYIADNDNNRIR
jgi:hypothetical protein